MRAHAQQRAGCRGDTWRLDTTLPVLVRAQLRTFFLMFGGTGCAPDKCTGPLGKVLSYKNLI